MGFSLADIPRSPLRSLLGNQGSSTGAIAVATVTSQVQIVSTIGYTVDGVWCSKGATDNFWTLPATQVLPSAGGMNSAVPVSTAFGSTTETAILVRYFFLGMNAAGTAYAYISNPPNTAAASQDGTLIPAFDDGVTIVGILKITLAAGYVFTPGTTLLGAAGVTAAYTNVSMLPVSLP